MNEKLKDRVRAMKQVVDGIKAIKFYAWEESYLELVADYRKAETDKIRSFNRLQVVGVLLGRAAPILSTATVFVSRTAQVSEPRCTFLLL